MNILVIEQTNTYHGVQENGYEDEYGFHVPMECQHDNAVVMSDADFGGLEAYCPDCFNKDLSTEQAVELIENYVGGRE